MGLAISKWRANYPLLCDDGRPSQIRAGAKLGAFGSVPLELGMNYVVKPVGRQTHPTLISQIIRYN